MWICNIIIPCCSILSFEWSIYFFSIRNIFVSMNIASSHVTSFLFTSSYIIFKCHVSYILICLIFVQEMYDYTHIPGQAVLHRGRHRHGARATSSGLRINLLLWCRRYTGLFLLFHFCMGSWAHWNQYVFAYFVALVYCMYASDAWFLTYIDRFMSISFTILILLLFIENVDTV